jgi:hypothetical protein
VQVVKVKNKMGKIEIATITYLAHINSVVENFNSALDSDGRMSEQDAIRTLTRSQNLIRKISEKDSPYAQEAESISKENWATSYKAEVIIGILLALRDELTIGSLNSVSELVRGELFENFLEMAEYLISEGYKDAAAVITGSSLETHLKRLANKYNIEIEIIEAGKKPKYKKAEIINQELYKIKVYSSLDQKQITAWLELRNNAAHGNYSAYAANQVIQFVEWTKDFISKNRA